MVYTHRTSGLNNGKAPEPSGRNASPPKVAQQASTVKLPQSLPPAPRSITSLIAAAGLPKDKLSASIISFARFFSLPIKPELMAAIRRQALSPMVQPPKTSPLSNTAAAPLAETAFSRAVSPEILAKNREALSLAAAAVKDKGAELNPEKLEIFTEAVDPDWQKRNPGRNSQGQRHKEQKNESSAGEGGASNKTNPLSAPEIMNMALESEENDPMLAILNRLPGKNGHFWVVLPFDFCESGREFKVSLRILIDRDNLAENGVRHMALDIAEYGEKERRWLFVPEVVGAIASRSRATMGGGAISRLTLYVQPELSPKALASLAHKMSQTIEIPLDNISVRNMTKLFPGESGWGDDLLCTVNEAI
jgi:hypothetical protein